MQLFKFCLITVIIETYIVKALELFIDHKMLYSNYLYVCTYVRSTA